jgi:hypothetical protein
MSDPNFCLNLSVPSDGDVLTWNEDKDHWEPRHHEHVMDSLKDVLSSTAKQGDILIFEENAKDYWLPNPLNLDTILDVNASEPSDGEVLTWDNSQKRWVPMQAQAIGGKFVQAPSGPYAIIAAGYFDFDGSPKKPSYNQLEADRIDTGYYHLNFPDYQGPNPEGKDLTYVVKGTILNPRLERAYSDGKFLIDQIEQAALQVCQLHEKYIEIWITKPILSAETIRKIVQEDERINNVIQFLPVDLPFMIEISQYGFKELGVRAGRVDINKASLVELEALPRLGKALARRIIERREALGRLGSIKDLIALRGISETTVTEIRPLITFEG